MLSCFVISCYGLNYLLQFLVFLLKPNSHCKLLNNFIVNFMQKFAAVFCSFAIRYCVGALSIFGAKINGLGLHCILLGTLFFSVA